MKKSILAGIAGGLIVAASVVAAGKSITNPTDMPLVNAAMLVSHALWILFGGLLIWIYFRNKQLEESGTESPKEPNSPEDIYSLEKKRNLTLAFTLLFFVMAGAESYILNNYSGLNSINATVIFSLLIALLYSYLIFELFRGKRNVLPILFHIAIIDFLGSVALSLWRDNWANAAFQIAPFVYLMFAIKAPMTRRNFRIAHFILLPAILILAITPFGKTNLDQLIKDQIGREQTFVTSSNNLNIAYGLFLNKPDHSLVRQVLEANTKRNQTLEEILSNSTKLKAEYEAQIPSVSQQMELKKLRNIVAMVDLNKGQGRAVSDFMKYAETLDFNRLTDSQKDEIGKHIQNVLDFNEKISAAQIEFNQ